MLSFSKFDAWDWEIWNACVNILAVEFLVKVYDWETYLLYSKKLQDLTYDEFSVLSVDISLNQHTRNLGEMISQQDYDDQLDSLLYFLDHPEDRFGCMED